MHKLDLFISTVLPLPLKMSGQGKMWSEEMENASDDDEEEEETETPSKKRPKTSPKTSDSPKGETRSGGQTNGSRPSSSSSKESKEKSENSIYSQFSKQDKEKAQHLLFTSIESNYFELLKDLLKLGVDTNIKNEDKATPLWLAIEEDHSPEMITSLMTPPLIGTRYKQNLTPLHRAAMKDDHDLILKMINKIRDKGTPLPDIVQTCEDDRIAQVRLERDKSGHGNYDIVNKKNKCGWTALHYAVHGGCVNVLQVLLMEKECDVAMTTKLEQTAFQFAARKGHLLCLKLLFAAAECSQSLHSLPTVDKNGWNIACHASAQDNCDVMKWLLDHMSNYGADINCPNKKGSTPLLIACEYQKTEMFKILHDKSSEVTQQTKDGKSVLHIAAFHDSVEIVRVLSEHFPVDLSDQYGETALHVAYKWGSTRVQRLLMEYGADDTIANNEGKQPQELAFKKFEIPKEIKKRGEAAIAKFVHELKKGKAKMPRCKLMILGEAGVGKTSLLSLLTDEPFNPMHNETEGVDTDFIRTSNICSNTWKKKAIEGDEDFKNIAAKQLAKSLPDEEQPVKHKKAKKVNVPSHAQLKQQYESLVKKYTKQREPSAPTKPKPKQPNITVPPVRHLPIPRFPAYPIRHSPPLFYHPPHPNPHPLPVVPLLSITPEATHVPVLVPEPSPVTTPAISKPTPRTKPRKKDTTPPTQQPPPQATDPSVIEIEAMRLAVKLKKSKFSDGQINIPLKFSSFDFAGQKHYKPMHHCFLTSRAVYVVAFNVRHLLDDQQDKCIQELKFWINSIHIYTDDTAKIVLVGTHRGPYPGNHGNNHLDPLTSQQEKTIHKVMKENFDKECYASQISWFENEKNKGIDDGIIAMVENSLRGDDSGENAIRDKLFKLGDQYPGNNDDLPTSYLRLEQKIFKERKQNTLISRKEVIEWAGEFGIDDPTVALTFFHDIGTIIDPSKLPTIFVDKEKLSVLKDTLLLSPQWLADVMKELMQIKRSDDRYDAKSLRRLQQEGIVDEKILSLLWVYQLKEREETFQFILIFLHAYGLIVPVGQQEPQQYYVPSQLPSTSKRMKKPTADCNKVHISFGHDDGFLPPFVLHHLMFKMYSDSLKGKHSDSPKDRQCCFLATESFIEPLCDCQWWMCQGDDVIEVRIRTKPSVRTILPAMQYLHQSLETILKELKAVTYTIGPVAECVGCEEQKSLEYITCEVNELRCPSCAHLQAIGITTAAIKSKAYQTAFKSFREEIKKFSENVQKHLEKRFKKKDKEDHESWNDILYEWYKENKRDPWPEVVSALESYDGSVDDILKEIKKDKLFLCNHID